jgi:hypothetical protein
MKRLVPMSLALSCALALTSCAKDSQQATATTTATESAANTPPAAPAESPSPTVEAAPKIAAAPKAVAPAAAKPDVIKPVPEPLPPQTIEVPSGTNINIVLTDTVSSNENKAGDTFTGSLAAPIVVNGETVAPRGSAVRGRVIAAEGAGKVKGTAALRIELTSLTVGQKAYPISTGAYAQEAESTTKKDAGVIAGGGGIGAAIGALAGGKKGAVTGAIIGGAAGTGAVLATKGKEVVLPSESKVSFTLDKPVELPKAR